MLYIAALTKDEVDSFIQENNLSHLEYKFIENQESLDGLFRIKIYNTKSFYERADFNEILEKATKIQSSFYAVDYLLLGEK